MSDIEQYVENAFRWSSEVDDELPAVQCSFEKSRLYLPEEVFGLLCLKYSGPKKPNGVVAFVPPEPYRLSIALVPDSVVPIMGVITERMGDKKLWLSLRLGMLLKSDKNGRRIILPKALLDNARFRKSSGRVCIDCVQTHVAVACKFGGKEFKSVSWLQVLEEENYRQEVESWWHGPKVS